MESQRRGKGILGKGEQHGQDLEARLHEPSNFLTETPSSISLFPRPLHQPPDTLCSSCLAFFINHQDSSGLLAPSESQQACGKSQVNDGWQEQGWAGRDGLEGKHIRRAGC